MLSELVDQQIKSNWYLETYGLKNTKSTYSSNDFVTHLNLHTFNLLLCKWALYMRNKELNQPAYYLYWYYLRSSNHYIKIMSNFIWKWCSRIAQNTFLVFAFNLIATRDEVTMTTSYMDVGNIYVVAYKVVYMFKASFGSSSRCW